jgi:outer membrane protein OmpA-like peptidoglycan-associated protein
LATTTQQLSDEREARTAADKRAADAQAALAKLAAVKDEARGMVITLSGSVLFASDRAVLLPEARTRLGQVADVLLTSKERNLTVEGHTDSQGSDSHNLDLSQRRADAVRTYLVERGYQGDLIKANGLGEGSPIADNASAEGRANNRRVEIIVTRETHATNP